MILLFFHSSLETSICRSNLRLDADLYQALDHSFFSSHSLRKRLVFSEMSPRQTKSEEK